MKYMENNPQVLMDVIPSTQDVERPSLVKSRLNQDINKAIGYSELDIEPNPGDLSMHT